MPSETKIAFFFFAVAALMSGMAIWFGTLCLQRQRRAELALAAARDATEDANRLKSGFLAAASHDLRQPLHAIHLFVSALRRRVTDEQAIDIVEKIAISAQSMQRMFNAVLDVSKLDAGAVLAVKRPFALSEIVGRLRIEFPAYAAEKGLSLSLPRSAFAVETDPVLLETILRNLLSNAINFTETGQVRLEVRPRSGGLLFEVTDTGPGLNETQLARVFDEFWRGETTGAAERGLGLGLPIVRRTAQLLGFDVEVKSKPGRGTCFFFTLPFPTARDAVAPLAATPATGKLSDKVVLIADDDALVRDAAAHEVADWGATVVTAFSGDNAIVKFRAAGRVPDLLIIDYNLRCTLDGLELIDHLRKLAGRALPAILVTGSTDADSLRRFREADCTFLIKPIDPAELRRTALRLLG
jgi:CheY-like chemotaxis protein/nitrogen-specific signal transduction histidine kinase